MPKSISIVIALLMHSVFLAIVLVVIIALWSGLTFRGITIGLFVFSMHIAGIFGIVKRVKWGYTFSKRIFGLYMVTSGLGFLGSFAGQSEIMTMLERAIFFIVFTWLFMRFRSDPSVRAYFERASMGQQKTAQS